MVAIDETNTFVSSIRTALSRVNDFDVFLALTSHERLASSGMIVDRGANDRSALVLFETDAYFKEGSTRVATMI